VNKNGLVQRKGNLPKKKVEENGGEKGEEGPSGRTGTRQVSENTTKASQNPGGGCFN